MGTPWSRLRRIAAEEAKSLVRGAKYPAAILAIASFVFQVCPGVLFRPAIRPRFGSNQPAASGWETYMKISTDVTTTARDDHNRPHGKC
jgi:hypothetical protein